MRGLLACLVLASCAPTIQKVTTPFASSTIPPAPDYALGENWAALPGKKDAADSIPVNSGLRDEQSAARADVFFIYPTIYTEKPRNEFPWNADVNDEALRSRIQSTTILNQATVFNASCRVYAPYYRQAHLYAFYTDEPSDGKKALDLAYEDVKRAFEYYLAHYNEGRPIVIGSHSQGSYHAVRLLKEFFDGMLLQNQLVFAYLPGRAIPEDSFSSIKPCAQQDDTGSWASWNTFARGYFPENYEKYYTRALSTNPLILEQWRGIRSQRTE